MLKWKSCNGLGYCDSSLIIKWKKWWIVFIVIKDVLWFCMFDGIIIVFIFLWMVCIFGYIFCLVCF